MAISGGDAILGRASILLGAEVDPNFGRNAEKGILGPLQGIAGKVTKILAGAFVARELFQFFKESAKLAAEDEKSITLLNFALDAMNISLADQAGAEKWIASMSKARGVMDDELRPALAQAARFTQDLTKAEELLGLAQDISIARGLPLINVVTALGKASTGNVAQLQRLGLAIKDSDGKALSAAEAFQKLTDQFGGAGLAAMDTAEGRARRLAVAWDEMKEQVGNALLPVLSRVADILVDDVIPAIRGVVGFLDSINDATDGWAGKLVLAGAVLGTFVFTIQKVHAIGTVFRLWLHTTSLQMGQGAAVAASYAGGIRSIGVAYSGLIPVIGLAVGAAALVKIELDKDTASINKSTAAMQAMSDSKLIEYLTDLHKAYKPSVWESFTQAIKNINLQENSRYIATQKAADVQKHFNEILETAPQFAQRYADAAKAAGFDTEGWGGKINDTVVKIREANADTAAFQQIIDETGESIVELTHQTGDEAIAMINAAAAGDAFRESQERGKKANEEFAAAFAELVDAIGPYEAGIERAGGLTAEQMSQMAADAQQFSADFAAALSAAGDPLAFFGDQTDITGAQLKAFLDQSLAATQAWAQDLQYAVAIGIDAAFVQELAKAGPRSAPILRATLELARDSSVAVTNELLQGTRNVGVISHNLWSGMSLDAILAARNMIHSVQDVLGWISALGAATKAAITGPSVAALKMPTLESVGVPKISASGSGSGTSAAAAAIKDATDAVADSIKLLQDQFKIGEITEQQLADQAGAMWGNTEKFSSSWMAIWDILNQNAQHIQDASDKAGKAAQDAADTAAKAAQEAAEKAAKAAADAAEKIAEAAAKAAAEYTEAFTEVVAALGKYGAAVLKARGLSTDQLKAMASEVRTFQSAVASSFASASSAIAAFGSDIEVTGQQLLDFQRQSLQDARDWSRNITLLMQYGLDASLLQPLAEAGPKAGALVKAYLDEIGLVGVDAVNQIARDQARVLAQTTATLTGGFLTGALGSQPKQQAAPVVNSLFTVQGSVYGIDDLNAYMDQRDAMIAAAVGAGQR